MPSFGMFSLVAAFALATLVRAADKVYDDTDPAWTYIGNWGAISATAPCPACTTQPDPTKTKDQTWHDLSQGGSAQLSFTGSGITVYAVCPKGVYRSNFTFLLDNEPVGQFLAPEGGCPDFVYNQVIFQKANFPLTPHIFQVNNWIAPGDQFSTSDLVLDYAVVDVGPQASGSVVKTVTVGASTTGPPSTSPTQPPQSPGKNTTVDDTDPAWTYTGPWGAISAANPCPACVTQPDATKAHGTTWHDLSQAGSAQLLFTGTALAVFAICPGPLAGGGVFSSDFAFTLDGKDAGVFHGPPNGCPDYVYNQSVYHVNSLELGTHNFTITNIASSSGFPSDLVLDYAVITGGTALSGPGTGASTGAPETSPTPSATPTPDGPEQNAAEPFARVSQASAAMLAIFVAMLAL